MRKENGAVVAISFLAALFLLSFVFSLGSSKAPSSEKYEGTITLSGAWALYPLAVQWGEEFHRLHPGVKVEVSAGGAGKGMADVLGGLVDIGMVSRQIDPAELDKGAYPIGVAKDAVVATANVRNPVADELLRKGISREVFKAIYIDETVKSWGEIVGGDAEAIHLYTRSDAAGAADVWAQYLGGKQENLKGVGVYGDPGLLSAVQNDALGIGYNNYNYVFDAKTGLPVDGIMVIPFDVNGNGVVDPSEDIGTKAKVIAAIKSGAFPHPPARVEYFVTKGRPAGLAADFIRWVLTDGQGSVDGAGYVALPNETVAAELKDIPAIK